ncbi:hypothetical protein GCM10029992_12240 [Glycomyces albus]
MHRLADKLWRQKMGAATGDWLDNAETLERMIALGEAERRLRDEAGPAITVRIGKHVFSAGIPNPEGLLCAVNLSRSNA